MIPRAFLALNHYCFSSMNFRHAPKLLLALCGLFCAVSQPAGAASITEPPLVLYGKIFKIGGGGRYQLFSGDLHLKVVNSLNPNHAIDLDVPLRQVGDSNEFSYRASISQETLPEADRLATTLVVSSLPTTYSIQSATVNGYPAALLDPSQAAQLTTSFSSRGAELRLDFKASVPLPDTDADGIPDWWESRYKLNPLSANDVAQDPDGDGMNNLKEFLNATDPLVANTSPLLQDSLLVVTAGGRAGIYLPIIDSDTPANNLRLALLEETQGLSWWLGANPLPAGTAFSYADVLLGKLCVEVAPGFQKAGLHLSIADLNAPQRPAVVSALQVEAFSPNLRWLGAPDVWLDAGALAQSGPVEEWSDRSVNRRDGYQPDAAARPLADGSGRLDFKASQFFFVDDREIQLGSFTAFMAFAVGGETAADQTLFSSPDLEVSIGGPDSGVHGRSLKVMQHGRSINGPVVGLNEGLQLTLNSAEDLASLRLPGQGSFGSRPGDDALLSTFTTVGARQQLSAPSAENFLQGSLREVLIYNRVLTQENQGLIEDYQLSRWQRMQVWNYRGATLPVKISGADGQRHSLSGGEGDDDLSGADQADILRGGRGNNRLAGRAGADRFRFSKTGSNDVVADFSPSSGDALDLTELFAGASGLPSKFVRVKTLVSRGANNLPRVDTRLELNFSGIGTAVDQTITLEGVGLGSSDLPRLVGEGNLQLGGPRYETAISLAISSPDPLSPGAPRQLTVMRTGNADAAIRVPVSLGGDARIDVDYHISGSVGTGAVRSLALARGAKQAVYDLVPTEGRSGLATVVSVTALPVAQVSDGGASLSLSLPGASTLDIQTLRHIHTQLGLAGGLVKVTRAGGLDQALDVPLITSGTLFSGVHFQGLPPSLHFTAGQTSYVFPVAPLASPPVGNEVPWLQIALAANPYNYHLGTRAETPVLWVSQGGADAALSYADWRKRCFPGATDASLDSADSDRDGKANLLEYLFGSDPSLRDDAIPEFSLARVADGYEVRWASPRALTDVRVALEETADFVHWMGSTIVGAEKRSWLPDGRIRHSYRFGTDAAVGTRFFRVRPLLVPTP